MPPTDPYDSYAWASPSPAEPADGTGGSEPIPEAAAGFAGSAYTSEWAVTPPDSAQPDSTGSVLLEAGTAGGVGGSSSEPIGDAHVAGAPSDASDGQPASGAPDLATEGAPGDAESAPGEQAADVLERHETTEIELTSRNVTPGTNGSRLPSRFTADLMRAILDATRAACMAVVEQSRTDADDIVESIRQRSGDGEADIERRAALDLASIEEWTRAAQARITEEGEQRAASRRESAAREIEIHRERAEQAATSTRARVEEFEDQVRAFVEELAEAPDPASLVARAQQMPEPPSLDAWPSPRAGAAEPAGESPAPWDVTVESVGATADEVERELRDEDASPLTRGIEGNQWGVLEAMLGPQIRPGDAGVLGLPIRDEPVSLPPREAPGGPPEPAEKQEPAPWDPGWGEARAAVGEPEPFAGTLGEDEAAAAEEAAAREAAAREVAAADRGTDTVAVDTTWRPDGESLAEPPSLDVASADVASADVASADVWSTAQLVADGPAPVEQAPTEWSIDSSPGLEPDAAWPRVEAPAWPSSEPISGETWRPSGDSWPTTTWSPESRPGSTEAIPPEPAPADAVAEETASAEAGPDEVAVPHPGEFTTVAVSGLSSVGAVTAFRRHLGEIAGVRNVFVRASADGGFVFDVSHEPGIGIGDAIGGLETFGTRVLGAGERELTVYAREPSATP